MKITTLCFIKINTPCNRSFEQLVYILLKDLDVHNCSRKFNVIDKLAFNNAGNTEPCSTLLVTVVRLDWILLSTTHCCLPIEEF